MARELDGGAIFKNDKRDEEEARREISEDCFFFDFVPFVNGTVPIVEFRWVSFDALFVTVLADETCLDFETDVFLCSRTAATGIMAGAGSAVAEEDEAGKELA